MAPSQSIQFCPLTQYEQRAAFKTGEIRLNDRDQGAILIRRLAIWRPLPKFALMKGAFRNVQQSTHGSSLNNFVQAGTVRSGDLVPSQPSGEFGMIGELEVVD